MMDIPDVELNSDNYRKTKLMISCIVAENFKSYAGKIEIGTLSSNFTYITGRNGCGKSNVLDSLLFVFDYKDQLPYSKLSKLIHCSPAFPDFVKCKVEVHFLEIRSKEDGGYEEVPSSRFVLARSVYTDESTLYEIDNNVICFNGVSQKLASFGIDLKRDKLCITKRYLDDVLFALNEVDDENDFPKLLEHMDHVFGTATYRVSINELREQLEKMQREICTQARGVERLEEQFNALSQFAHIAKNIWDAENRITRLRSKKYQYFMYKISQNFETKQREKIEIDSELAEYEERRIGLSERQKELKQQIREIYEEWSVIFRNHWAEWTIMSEWQQKLKSLMKSCFQCNEQQIIKDITIVLDEMISRNKSHWDWHMEAQKNRIIELNSDSPTLSWKLKKFEAAGEASIDMKDISLRFDDKIHNGQTDDPKHNDEDMEKRKEDNDKEETVISLNDELQVEILQLEKNMEFLRSKLKPEDAEIAKKQWEDNKEMAKFIRIKFEESERRLNEIDAKLNEIRFMLRDRKRELSKYKMEYDVLTKEKFKKQKEKDTVVQILKNLLRDLRVQEEQRSKLSWNNVRNLMSCVFNEKCDDNEDDALINYTAEQMQSFDTSAIDELIEKESEYLDTLPPIKTVVDTFVRKREAYLKAKEILTTKREKWNSCNQCYKGLKANRDARFKTASSSIARLANDHFQQLMPREGQLLMEFCDRSVNFPLGQLKMSVKYDDCDGRLNMKTLSPGEMSVVKLAVMFALQDYKPIPFCFMDGIDLVLDCNITSRFLYHVKEQAEKIQMVVISYKSVGVQLADRVIRLSSDNGCTVVSSGASSK